jgi:hypothetical protein
MPEEKEEKEEIPTKAATTRVGKGLGLVSVWGEGSGLSERRG